MQKTLKTIETYLTSGHGITRNIHKEDEINLIRFLERVLEFSATWNGVKTMNFFPESPQLRDYFAAKGMERLGGFFSRPFVEVTKELREIGIEYPFLLKKLYEAYYLRTLSRRKLHAPVTI